MNFNLNGWTILLKVNELDVNGLSHFLTDALFLQTIEL